MPLQLCNALLTFQHVVNDVLLHYLAILVSVYIHDIFTYFKNTEDHLNPVHELLQKQQLFLCIDKTTLFQCPLPCFGSNIDKEIVHMDPDKRSF